MTRSCVHAVSLRIMRGPDAITCDAGVVLGTVCGDKGAGWVRRLPCREASPGSSLPRLPGGSECALRRWETPEEHEAKYAPIVRLGTLIDALSPADLQRYNADPAAWAEWLRGHGYDPSEVTVRLCGGRS